MSLENHKITSYEKSIASLPDKVQGKADELKAMFGARTDGEVKEKHNALIDALQSTAEGSGAKNIGFTPYGAHIPATNLQDAIVQTYNAIDKKVVDMSAGDMAQALYDPYNKRMPLQTEQDNGLHTNNKAVVGAINEVHQKTVDTDTALQSANTQAEADKQAATVDRQRIEAIAQNANNQSIFVFTLKMGTTANLISAQPLPSGVQRLWCLT